jgi:hypothetical protein
VKRLWLLLALLGVPVVGAFSCGGDSDSGEHGGESGEHSEAAGSEEGEESGSQIGLGDTYGEVRAGARLVISYDASVNAFTGTVENTANETLSEVRVEVHLSNGAELGPTPRVDLAPGEVVEVALPATEESFATWSAHPEVGGGESESGEHDGD